MARRQTELLSTEGCLLNALRNLVNHLKIGRAAHRTGFRVGGASKEFVSGEAGNELIRSAISRGEPLMVARHGATELIYVAGPNKKKLGMLRDSSGFFPASMKMGKRFRDLYLDCSRDIDIIAVWNYRHGRLREEEWLFADYSPNADLADLASLTPFLFEKPWSSALAGKRVLVVHPFSSTIQAQYEKRSALFANSSVLPEFSGLTAVTAVQSLRGENSKFETWFDALEHMKRAIEKVDFDVALIGCGAYGLPLAAHVKRLGKQGIHVGGALQLLFGIKGKRWESGSYDYDTRFYNEHWVRPSEGERPPSAEKMEGGCYW